MLTRLPKCPIQQLAPNLRFTQKQARYASAHQQQRIDALGRYLAEERDAFVEPPRPIGAVARKDRQRAVRNVREHRRLGRISLLEQLHCSGRGHAHLVRLPGPDRGQRRVGQDADRLQPIHRLDRGGGRRERAVALDHRAAPHGDVSVQAVDVDQRHGRIRQLSGRRKQPDGAGSVAAEPGVLGGPEEPIGAKAQILRESG